MADDLDRMETRGNRPLTMSMLVTGIISLVTGVAVALIVQFATEKRHKLEYDVIKSALFDGKKQKTAIVQVNITNNGSKEVENIVSTISFPKSAIVEPRITGLIEGTYSIQHQRSSLDLRASFLNPGDTFSLQMLIEPPEAQLDEPIVVVRAKGISAVPRPKTSAPWAPLFEIALPVIASLFAAITLVFLRTYRIGGSFTKKHIDDQRDVFAYVLGAHNFYDEADRIRHLGRDFTYWSASDRLSEMCIGSGDPDQLRRGVNCLLSLLEYAEIDKTYMKIIHVNISRMSAANGNEKTAREHLAIARNPHHEVIEKRIALDENLSRLANTSADSN